MSKDFFYDSNDMLLESGNPYLILQLNQQQWQNDEEGNTSKVKATGSYGNITDPHHLRLLNNAYMQFLQNVLNDLDESGFTEEDDLADLREMFDENS